MIRKPILRLVYLQYHPGDKSKLHCKDENIGKMSIRIRDSVGADWVSMLSSIDTNSFYSTLFLFKMIN
jgi:hypothetical protein